MCYYASENVGAKVVNVKSQFPIVESVYLRRIKKGVVYMQKKYRTIICYLLAGFMLVVGLYSERITISSAFSCVQQESTSYVLSFQSVVKPTRACTGEMLGIFQERDVRAKSNIKFLLYFLIPNVCFLHIGQSYMYVKEVCVLTFSQEKRITDYMHKADGKKRILCFS